MGDLSLNCPLCCDKSFTTKESLLEHLTSTIDNLYCPICSNKFSSVSDLTKHLSHENCASVLPSVVDVKPASFNKIEYEGDDLSESNEFQSNTVFKSLENDEQSSNANGSFLPVQSIVDNVVSKMYVDPNLQGQELKLVKHSSDRYVIITDEHADFTSGTIVTKQNQDGTISLTAVRDEITDQLEPSPESLMGPQDSEPESTEELYSCNTCGVSFSSVIDHIQNYHNDQDVVVEGSLEDNEVLPVEYDYNGMETEDAPATEKMTSRRVITDTGDIVETPLLKSEIEEMTIAKPLPVVKEQATEKKGKGAKKYIQVDKLCDSVIKDLKQNDQQVPPYHKVIMKETSTPDGNKVKSYKCMWCQVTVFSLADFKQHPCKQLKYSCSQCSVTYDNAKSLCAHMKMHKVKPCKTEVPEVFECELCCTVFSTNKSLKLHKRMHDPHKSRPIEGPVNSHHGADLGRYRCPICDKLIPVAYKSIHQNSHNTDTMLNCDICNKKFTSQSYLEMHMNVHNYEKAPQSKQDKKSLPYCCVYCDRRFARPHEKVKHERIHTGEKPHSCEVCGKSFRVSYCLTLHMRTHTGARPYACQYCGKRFKAQSVYNHHLLTHSDVRAYKCPYCPKAFKTSVQLAGHKNSHTKPFSCTFCNRPFASLYAVRVHTETHGRVNNLKFSCARCGASYARAFALKDHMRQAHPDDNENGQEEWITQDATDNNITLNGIDLNKPMLLADENKVSKMEITNDELIVPN